MTPLTQGIHHVGLTVPDCRATADFFIDALVFSEIDGKPDYPPIFVADGTVMLTLWQAVDPDTARSFDRNNNARRRSR